MVAGELPTIYLGRTPGNSLEAIRIPEATSVAEARWFQRSSRVQCLSGEHQPLSGTGRGGVCLGCVYMCAWPRWSSDYFIPGMHCSISNLEQLTFGNRNYSRDQESDM